ncbi:MAG: glycosyltransferase [Caldilineaceae bacterium]|nr:glycosyltransferase [Caldilineaceae bacterium]
MTQPRIPRYQPIKVVDIEVTQPIETIRDLEHYASVKGLVRLHGAPLGYVQLGVVNGCCPAVDMSRCILEQYGWPIARHLISNRLMQPLPAAKLSLPELLHAEHAPYAGPTPLVTVAVCTRDRTEDLALCLDALAQLRYAALEILIVDNAPSNDATESLIRTRYPQVRYCREPRPGLSWARNRAILEASGEIIAFTDDDVVVDPNWVAALSQTFVENPDVMAVTGLVVPYELETEPQILFEVHGGFGRGFERQRYQIEGKWQRQTAHYHGAGKFGTGANMAFRRRLFDLIGYFDPALGVGTVTNGGEDLEMFFRLLHQGYPLIYEPLAFVRHRHRRTYEELRRQLANNALGVTSFHVRGALHYPEERKKFLWLQWWWLIHWHFKRLAQSLTRPHRFPRDLIWAELDGYLRGLTRYSTARRKAAAIIERFGPLHPTTSATVPTGVLDLLQ